MLLNLLRNYIFKQSKTFHNHILLLSNALTMNDLLACHHFPPSDNWVCGVIWAPAAKGPTSCDSCAATRVPENMDGISLGLNSLDHNSNQCQCILIMMIT